MAGKPYKPAGARADQRASRRGKSGGGRPPGFVPPACPAGLLKRSRDEWAALWASPRAYHLDPTDHRALAERWIALFDERERIWRDYRRERDAAVWRRVQSAERMLAKAEDELGISPTGRTRWRLPETMSAAELNRRMSEPDEPMGPRLVEWESL